MLLSVCLSVCLSICLSVCLSVCRSLLQVFLTEVQEIRMGMRTANFKRLEGMGLVLALGPDGKEKAKQRWEHHELAAFSIVTQNRTIDILCPTPEVMDHWVLGLRFLVDRLRPPPPAFPAAAAELDHWAVMARLRRGGFLLKFGQIGRPHERYFRVSASMRQMLWAAGDPCAGSGYGNGGYGGNNGGNGNGQLRDAGSAGAGGLQAGALGIEHKAVDLSGIHGVRLFRHAQPGGVAPVFTVPSLHPFSRGVDDYQYGFSLLNAQGQAKLNLVAPNAYEYGLWTRGFELIVRHFQDEAAEAHALAQHAREEAAEEAAAAAGNEAEAATTQAEAGAGGEAAGAGAGAGEGLAQLARARPRRGLQLSVYDRGNYLAFQPLSEPLVGPEPDEPARPRSAAWATTSAAQAGCWREEARAAEEKEEKEAEAEAGREAAAVEALLLPLTPVVSSSPSKTTPASSLSPLPPPPPPPPSTREPVEQEEEEEEAVAATAGRQPHPAPAANGLPVLVLPTNGTNSTNGNGGGDMDRGAMVMEEEAWSPAPSSPASSSLDGGDSHVLLLPLEEDGGDGVVMRGASVPAANTNANGKLLTPPEREEREEGEKSPHLDPLYATSASFLHFVHGEGNDGGGGGSGGDSTNSSNGTGNAAASR